MFKKILNRREKIILCINAAVIISAVFAKLIIYPLSVKYGVLNQDIRISRARLMKYTQILSRKNDLQNRCAGFFGDFKPLRSSDDAYIEILSALENIAKLSNIRITDIRPQHKPDQTVKKEVIVDIKTEGLLENHIKFIYEIEASLWLLRIKRIQLSVKSNTDKLEGSFTIYQLSAASSVAA